MQEPRVSPQKFFIGAVVFLTLAIISIVAYTFPHFTTLGTYLVAVNVSLLIVFGYDKGVANSIADRVPERVFLCGALLGGGPGILLSIRLFRHKTRKSGFQFVIFAITIVEIVLLKCLIGELSFKLLYQ